MILQTAIDRFLERRLINTDIAKRYTTKRIRQELAKLPVKPEMVYPQFRHQQICFLLGLRFPGFFLMLDMGLGKSKIAIDLFRYRQQVGDVDRVLVLVPSTSNVDAWRQELLRHAPSARVGLLDESTSKIERQRLFFEADVDVLVCTYMGLLSLLCRRKKGGGRMALNSKLRKQCAARFQMLVADESTFFKNPKSVTFSVLRSLSKSIPYRYLLSGTPFNSDPQGLWPQFFICDHGETLGQTLGLFRAAFFLEDFNGFATIYKLAKRKEGKLHRTLKHRSIRYMESECQDLPKKVGGIARPMLRLVRASKEQIIANDQEWQALREAVIAGQPLDAPYYRMRAVASGYLPLDDKQFIDFKENPKLDGLLDLLHDNDKQWIVFFVYVHTADLITARLKKHKISCVEVSGRTKNKQAALAKFRDGARVMLGNRAAVFGLNLQFCSHTVFFETPDSIADRSQAEKRTHRYGQQLTTYFYDLVMPGTIDDKIMLALKERKRVHDVVIDGV